MFANRTGDLVFWFSLAAAIIFILIALTLIVSGARTALSKRRRPLHAFMVGEVARSVIAQWGVTGPTPDLEHAELIAEPERRALR